MTLSQTLPIAWNGQGWVTLQSIRFEVEGRAFAIEAGFSFDRASVPKVLRSFFDRDRLGVAGPLLHDHLYRTHQTSRAFADRAFRLVMARDGVEPWRRGIAWLAVRLGGYFAWRRPEGFKA